MSRLSASEIIYAGARRKLLEIGRATRDEGQGVGTLSLVLRLDIRDQRSAVSSQRSAVSGQQLAVSGQQLALREPQGTVIQNPQENPQYGHSIHTPEGYPIIIQPIDDIDIYPLTILFPSHLIFEL